jgi:hypothetical protein
MPKYRLLQIGYTLILSTHLRLGLYSHLFLTGLPINNLSGRIVIPFRATYSAHRNLLDLIILNILDGRKKSRSSSLCSFVHPPVPSSLSGPNILLSALSLQFPTQTEPHANFVVLYIPMFTIVSGDEKTIQFPLESNSDFAT